MRNGTKTFWFFSPGERGFCDPGRKRFPTSLLDQASCLFLSLTCMQESSFLFPQNTLTCFHAVNQSTCVHGISVAWAGEAEEETQRSGGKARGEFMAQGHFQGRQCFPWLLWLSFRHRKKSSHGLLTDGEVWRSLDLILALEGHSST